MMKVFTSATKMCGGHTAGVIETRKQLLQMLSCC